MKITPGEGALVLLAFAYHWLVFASYAVLKPLRDNFGVEQGIDELPLLGLAVLGVMALIQPPFALLVTRFDKRTFVPLAYHAAAAVLLVFFALLPADPSGASPWVARAFFVWVSVFNLFVISVFWAVMADTFDPRQGARLFGIIAAAASLGNVTGAALTSSLVGLLGVKNLVLASIVLLELAVLCVVLLARRTRTRTIAAPATSPAPSPAPVPAPAPKRASGALEGFARLAKSPYLLGICAYILLYACTSTFLYVEKANVAAAAFPAAEDAVARTVFFARVTIAVNTLALVLQLFAASRFLSRLGARWGLAAAPLVTIAGFAALGLAPGLAVVAAFEVARSGANYGFGRPARELLFTVVDKAEKFKAKTFIDTFVYRTGDALGNGVFWALQRASLSLAAIAWCAIPVAAVWLATGWWLGRVQQRRSEQVAVAARGAAH